MAVSVLFENNVDATKRSKIIRPSLCASCVVADREIKLGSVLKLRLTGVAYESRCLLQV